MNTYTPSPEVIAEIERLSEDGVTRDGRPAHISKDVWSRYALEPRKKQPLKVAELTELMMGVNRGHKERN